MKQPNEGALVINQEHTPEKYENIAEFKETIATEFARLQRLCESEPRKTNIDRTMAGLVPAGTLAKELGIELDTSKMLKRLEATNTPLNIESRYDIGLGLCPEDEKNFKKYFDEPNMDTAQELRHVSQNYERLFTALYVSRITKRHFELPPEVRERLINAAQLNLETIKSMEKIAEEYDFLKLKGIVMSILTVAKEFGEFLMTKEEINSLFQKIKEFEREGIISQDAFTENRIYLTKLILTILNEKYTALAKAQKELTEGKE